MPLKTATTIEDFGPALKALLAAQPALATVPVTDGPPAPGTFDGAEWVALLDVEFAQRTRALNTTTRPRLENYTQNVLISVVQQSRSDHTTPGARAWALFAAVADAIRGNPTLTGYFTGDGQIVAVEVGSGRFTKAVGTDALSREASIEFGLQVEARI